MKNCKIDIVNCKYVLLMVIDIVNSKYVIAC